MAKKYYWLKLKFDWFDSKIVKKLRKIAGGDTYTIIYLKMQLLSLKNEGKLYYEGVEDNFIEELALDLDEDTENVKITVQFLQRCGLIEMTETDEYMLTEVPEAIGCETDSAERKRRSRANINKKLLEEKAGQCHTEVTTCHTEIEIEKEIEKEINITVSKDTVRQTEVRQAMEAWNSLSQYGIKSVTRVSSGSKRYGSLVARIKEYGIENVLAAIEKIKHSSFLQGKTHGKRQWVITFDWFVLPNNFPKVFEGNYDDEAEDQPVSSAYSDRLKELVNQDRGDMS